MAKYRTRPLARNPQARVFAAAAYALLISDLRSRIFAVVCLIETRVNNFFSPDLVSSSLWMGSEVFVSFIEIAVNRQHAFFGRLVIAIVDYCSGHTRASKSRGSGIGDHRAWPRRTTRGINRLKGSVAALLQPAILRPPTFWRSRVKVWPRLSTGRAADL